MRGDVTNNYVKALDLWEAPPQAGEPRVCIATSFTFDATFFETECLGRFLQMNAHPGESDSIGYLVEREEKLAAAKVGTLIDRRHARDKESLRWDVVGVVVPRGIQHAKVSLLAWTRHVRVIIGSGNLTEAGYRKNLEVFGTVELSPTEGGDRDAVAETILFLLDVLELGIGEIGASTPKDRIRQALLSVRRLTARWPNIEGKARRTTVFGRPTKNVLKQLQSGWPDRTPPREVWALSPFFDRPGRDIDTVSAVIDTMASRGQRDFNLCVKTEPLPDGRTRVYAPREMVRHAQSRCDVSVYSVSGMQKGEPRALHAKMLWLENDNWSMLSIGSSNFTAAGLASHRGGNLEANLAYVVKGAGADYDRANNIWPDYDKEVLDPDSPLLVWNPELEEVEEAGDQVPLPECFRDAIYSPGPKPRLLIYLGDDLPRIWSIRAPDGDVILSEGMSPALPCHALPWVDRTPPFLLEVSWQYDGAPAIASWPVNVADPAMLEPPEALRNLSLEELIEVLSSSRPLPDAVVAVLKKRGVGKTGLDITLDPLRRFDSHAFLLRRTKRVATALDRLRERLERPVLSSDAFEWRLNGAIGPRSLANAFVRDAKLPGEADFYLAELALALSRVRAGVAATGGLDASTIETLLSVCIDEVKSKADGIPRTQTLGALDAYIKSAFKEARRT